MNIIEIETPNVPRNLKQYQHDDRFVAYEPGGSVSEPMPFGDAMRLAAGKGGDTRIGFIAEPAVTPLPRRKTAKQ